jgi:lipoate synthase
MLNMMVHDTGTVQIRYLKPLEQIIVPIHLNDFENEKKAIQFLLDLGYNLYRYNIGNKEDCILVHPENLNAPKSLSIIENIKDKYNIIKES